MWGRARALHDSLREPADERALKRALVADTWWGVAALVWLITGLWRLLASTEKSTSYYMSNHAFYAKMGLFLAILLLEIWPMMTLIKWRMGKAQPHARDVGRIEVISYVECALVIGMVFAAASMARGHGVRGSAIAASVAEAVTDSLTALGDSAEATTKDSVVTTSSSTVMPRVEPTPADVDVLHAEMAMPLAGIDPNKLKSNFNELRGGVRRHEALDIMAPRRTPILSASSGRVLKLFTSKAGGLMVYAADSAEKFILMYAHLDSYAAGIQDGSPLKRGQLIGYVGFTGNASPTAPHLHFAIARSDDVKRWWQGTAVDPLPLLQGAKAH